MNPRAKLTVKQAAQYLHVSVSTLKRWRADNTGPTWFKATDAINSPCLYEVADLDRWVMMQKGKA
ncbi:helix-turn-helix domain-containing protein [Bifidobacterium longum]|uniref:helix-turn-helix domain-containing protein n=1 Tax=Bifidobacterium longum TaxID=216816 RepID=UPI001C383251|nr:helix-turn-helix domain-containing protein [Bifidobacterium longum]MBV3546737.1 helix-turn-helix domain-containing protein [Bifidobacterium longum]